MTKKSLLAEIWGMVKLGTTHRTSVTVRWGYLDIACHDRKTDAMDRPDGGVSRVTVALRGGFFGWDTDMALLAREGEWDELLRLPDRVYVQADRHVGGKLHNASGPAVDAWTWGDSGQGIAVKGRKQRGWGLAAESHEFHQKGWFMGEALVRDDRVDVWSAGRDRALAEYPGGWTPQNTGRCARLLLGQAYG